MRTRAKILDRNDPLAGWRDEFVLPDPELIYLDGNSLGRAPKRTTDALRTVVEEHWGRRPDHVLVGPRLARHASHRWG